MRPPPLLLRPPRMLGLRLMATNQASRMTAPTANHHAPDVGASHFKEQV